ncbi:MAG: hypothetical protein Q9165_008061 [Trypethelium subeluteriae]
MELMRLPNELLDNIIEFTLPQGFENVALTCKRMYARSTPFIERHHELRSRFGSFEYYLRPRGLSLMSASDLIMLIATEPVVARYIRTATFEIDSLFLRRERPKSVPSIDNGGAVVEMFANSAYLKQAGLDWKEYYTIFEDDVKERRYSQHGATFLLTLLPHVEKLILPRSWKPNDMTNKLLDTIVCMAKRSRCLSSASLTSVARFEASLSLGTEERFDLSWAGPFLALPSMQSFHGPSCLALRDDPRSLIDSHHIAETLRAAHLMSCCMDEVGITSFLKHTPHLKTLRYWHCTKIDSPVQDWDICSFINAIKCEAGSHLTELSVTIRELHGSIIPGKVSMCGFQRLTTLEYPLELVICNITTAAGHTSTPSKPLVSSAIDPFVSDLIPTSVAKLSLVSQGTDHHENALNALFRQFHAVKKIQLSALQEIHISCPDHADDAYKRQCDKIVTDSEDTGVVVLLKPFPSSHRFLWNGEP